MILKHIKKALTLSTQTIYHTQLSNTFFPNYRFSETTTQSPPQTANYIEQYRNILIKLNALTLKNEMVHMKKCTKKEIIKLKKMEIIDQLCRMGQEAITARLQQLSNTTILQLDSRAIYQLGNGGLSTKKVDTNPQSTNQLPYQQSFPTYEQNKTSANILKESLKKLLTTDINKVLHTEQISNENIIDAIYENWIQKNKELKEKQQTIKFNNEKQKNNQNEEKSQPKLPEPIEHIKAKKKLRKKPFLNRLFKTNQQLIIEQKNRKYSYENDKADIINQIFDTRPSNIREYVRTMEQISQEKKESQVMKGFTMRYSHQKYKIHFYDKQKVLRTFCGFFYYKQLLSTPHLIQFIFALTFDRDLPLEFTILKIVEQYLQCPQTFNDNLKSISKEHYLKFLRASSSYILKLFKKIDTQTQNNREDGMGNQIMMVKSENGLNKWQKDEEETSQTEDYYGDDDVQYQQKQRVSSKLSQQKFPKSKQYIDLQLLRFALAIFEVGVQRVSYELIKSKDFFLDGGEFIKLKLSQKENKQLKSTHETLMLSFEVFKTIQGLFTSIEINDFSDLQKLSHVLVHYSHIRQRLSTMISTLHKFMLNYDRHFEEKLQLGLGSIPTQKQLQIDNFILKHQARKLNFDLMDNIISMLKHDNLQITLQNKRQQIFAVLERIFQVYIQNAMIDFLEEQLIYNIMRFLEKEVYLDNKVKSLFETRVNFDIMMAVKEKERKVVRNERKQQQQGVSPKVNSEQQQKTRKQSMMQSLAMNASSQYDFSNLESQPQLSTSQQTSSTEFQWFQLQSIYPSQQQSANTNQYDFNQLVFQKSEKSQYFMGRISELMSRQLLGSLIRIIKYKHQRKEIEIKQINGFNLIQEWYSEPSAVRLQFLKEEIIGRYKRMGQYNNV